MGVFVHGLGANGGQVFGADRDLVDGHVGLHQVPPGTDIAESRIVALESNAPITEIRVGVYFSQTGQRLRAWRSDGSEWSNNEVIIPVVSGACDAMQP
jgi:hypothetical protein